MFLVPDGDELEIADAAATYLADTMPIDRLHRPDSTDMDAAMRASLGEMGWFALALPEVAGGSGLTAIEHALFFREVGRQCGPIDVLAQSLAALAIDDETLRADILGGGKGVALAVSEADESRVLGSPKATLVLSVSRERAEIFAQHGGANDVRRSLDPATSIALASQFANPLVSTEGPLFWQLGQLGVAAMLVGIAEAALDQIVEYAKVRETFGRKIGAWQAVRHPCADMAIRVEAARSQLWYAATALKEGRLDAPVHLDAAKHLANLAAVANADTNIQLHGGIGVTDEHHAHLYLKHALVLAKLFGAKRDLLGRLLHAEVDD